MPQETTPRSAAPWIVSAAAAAFAIGVATSPDAINNIFFDIQDAIVTYKGGNIPQILTGLPSQAQYIPPSTFAALPAVPPENIANITTASNALPHIYFLINLLLDIYSTGLYVREPERTAIPRLPPGIPWDFGPKPNSHPHR